MKKIISTVLILAFLLSMSVPVFAANAGISADKTSVKKGETVTVTLLLDAKMTDITNFEYSIYFDSDVFELQSSEKGTACSMTQISNLKSDTKGSFYSVSFVDTTSEGVEVDSGPVYMLIFKAVKDIKETAESSFELKKVSVMDTTWGQVADAGVGTAKIDVSVTSDDGQGGETVNFEDITLTISAPAKVEKTEGTSFNAIVYSTKWDNQHYKLLDGIVSIPAGVEVTSVTAGDRLSGGNVNNYVDSENNLRFVYCNDTLTDITLEGSEFPAPLFTIAMKTTSDVSGTGTIGISGASLKLNSDSESEASMNVLKIAETADEQGNTGSAEITFTEPAVISVTAAELFIGDGIDIIPADKKGIVVSVSGLADKNVKLQYKKGDTTVSLLFSEEITELVGNLCYVAVVGKDEVINDYANWSNYTADTAKKSDTVTFGDTNGDGTVNAQDALNAVNVWLRSKTIDSDQDYLKYNVNSDSRINTFDALGIEEAFVNSSSFKITTRAAGLVSKATA